MTNRDANFPFQLLSKTRTDHAERKILSLLQPKNVSLEIDSSLWQYLTHMNCEFSYELIKS